MLCLVPYPTLAASNRLRVEQYGPALRDQGISLVVSPFLDERAYRLLYEVGRELQKGLAVARGIWRRALDLMRAGEFDLVLIHREAAPLGPPLVERWLEWRRIPYVFDFDDAIFIRAVHQANRRWRWLRQRNTAETARRARSVIVSNDYLATWARTHNRVVTVIPTPVDTDRHRPRVGDGARAAPVIGWVGSSTTAAYLRILDEPLRQLAARHPVRVRVIGGTYRHETVEIDQRPYSLTDEPADVAAFDIGVLPEPDDAWTRGKGAFKALVYMAAGLPVVASRVGVNPEVVLDGETGFCVDGPEEWTAALERLVLDPELRRRLGAAGRQRAVEHYSIHVMAPRLGEALRGADSRSSSE